jgi:hypothetical protein
MLFFCKQYKIKNWEPEYQFLISINNPKESAECFERRWQIDHEVVPKVNNVQGIEN